MLRADFELVPQKVLAEYAADLMADKERQAEDFLNHMEADGIVINPVTIGMEVRSQTEEQYPGMGDSALNGFYLGWAMRGKLLSRGTKSG